MRNIVQALNFDSPTSTWLNFIIEHIKKRNEFIPKINNKNIRSYKYNKYNKQI